MADEPLHNANMKQVLSSHILAVGHDPATGMIVEYVDGSVVLYPGVESDVVGAIANAPSPGSALHAFVRSMETRHEYLRRSPLRAVPKNSRESR